MRYITGIRQYHSDASTKSSIHLGYSKQHLLRFPSRDVSQFIIMNVLRTNHIILRCNPCIRYTDQDVSIKCAKLLQHTSARNVNTMKTKRFRDTAGRGPYEPKQCYVLYRGLGFFDRQPKNVIQPPSTVTLNTASCTATTQRPATPTQRNAATQHSAHSKSPKPLSVHNIVSL